MGAKCSLNSCNIMEVTNLNFGEDSEASHQRETSSDSNGETDTENGETDSESQTDNSSTSYSLTETESDQDNNYNKNNKNTQKYKRSKRKRRKKSMSISNTNPDEGGGIANDDRITDVSDLSNSTDDDNDIDYATDVAINGSMSDGTPSTAMNYNSSSSGLSTPIPSPSPLEIIRMVQLKQEQIRAQIEKRRHSLPSTHASYWINRKRSSLRPQTPQITGENEYNYSNIKQEQQVPIPRPMNVTHRSRSAMDPNQNSIDIDISKSILKHEINIEDMYNNNDYHEPQPLYNEFTVNVPNTAPSFDSPNSIEEDLAKIPTISVLDKPMDIGFASSDEIPSDDNYASNSEVSSSEEYAGDDDEQQGDTLNYKRKKIKKSTRIAPWRSHHRKNSSHSNSQRMAVLSDDEEEKGDININEVIGVNVVDIIHDINEIHVPILSPTQSKSGGHSNSASLDGTNKHLHIRIQSLEDDIKGGLLNDEFDDVLPLASITPTNSFDADTLRKVLFILYFLCFFVFPDVIQL